MSTTTAGLLEAAPAVSLTELADRAALLRRVDRKYLVDAGSLAGLLEALADADDLRVLDIDGRRTFDYVSTYVDSEDLECYRAAARRSRRRFKVRTRTYLDCDLSWLEVKLRGSRGHTEKHRMPVDLGPALRGDLPADRAGEVDAILQDWRLRPVTDWLSPVLRTEFRRATLYLPSSHSRVTIDTGLTWSDPAASGRHAPTCSVPAGYTIVETKSNGAACAADRLLWSSHHRPLPLSKYAIGLALLRPGLPANRWHRTLREIAGPDRGRPARHPEPLRRTS